MPSWQSRLLQIYLRATLKKRLSGDEQKIAQFARKKYGNEALAARMTPKDVSIKLINENGVNGEWVWWEGNHDDRVIFHLHGGAYVACSPKIYRGYNAALAKLSRTRIFSLDYRLAPEHRFPAPVEDAVKAYRWLLAQGIAPEKIIFNGDSAGGGLVLATLVALRDAGDPLPAMAFCLSPWTDLTASGNSVVTNDKNDVMFWGETGKKYAQLYLNSADASNPLASPLFADLTSLPPLFIYVSDTEMLFDDSVRLAERARQYGVKVKLTIEKSQPHVWPIFVKLIPEATATLQDIAQHIRTA